MRKKPKARKPPTGLKRVSSTKATTESTASPSKWIRIEQPFPLPVYVKDALQKLDEAGHIAYIVGGSVRDFLLGRPCKDFDIATSADPDELCRLFPNALTVGKSFGVIKIPVEGKLLEIATFREDLEYRDHRHPSGVLFSGPTEDARRRDFTINALFYDSKTQRILDTVQGVQDIQKKQIRAIGDPLVRFNEDALRLLRAIRFNTVLEFSIESNTLKALSQSAKLIRKVSAERSRDELTSMLTSARPGKAFGELFNTGLIAALIPELVTLKEVRQPPIFQFEGDVWSYTLKVMDTLARWTPERPAALCWAALLHEIGKPEALKKNSGKNFNGHEQIGSQKAKAISERFKISKNEISLICILIEDQLKFRSVFEMREATLQRWIREPHFPYSLSLHRATAMVADGNLAYYEFCSSRFADFQKTQGTSSSKLIDGEDLIQLGFVPGREFSRILHAIEDLALEGSLQSKEQALEYVLKNFVK